MDLSRETQAVKQPKDSGVTTQKNQYLGDLGNSQMSKIPQWWRNLSFLAPASSRMSLPRCQGSWWQPGPLTAVRGWTLYSRLHKVSFHKSTRDSPRFLQIMLVRPRSVTTQKLQLMNPFNSLSLSFHHHCDCVCLLTRPSMKHEGAREVLRWSKIHDKRQNHSLYPLSSPHLIEQPDKLMNYS